MGIVDGPEVERHSSTRRDRREAPTRECVVYAEGARRVNRGCRGAIAAAIGAVDAAWPAAQTVAIVGTMGDRMEGVLRRLHQIQLVAAHPTACVGVCGE